MVFQRRVRAILAIALFAPSAAAFSACPGNKQPLFACTTTKGKAVQVCDAGRTIQYAFGKKGATPELALSVPRASATTHQWDGMGPMFYTVRIPNGNTVYEVGASADRQGGLDGWISVESNGRNVANIACKADTVIWNIEGVDLRAAE